MDTPHTPESQPAHRNRTKKAVRELVRRLEAVTDRASTLFNAPGGLRLRAAGLLSELIEHEVSARLDQLPINELRAHLKPGTRLRPFENHGFNSIGSILATSPQHLASLDGVSDTTVAQVRHAAHRVHSDLTADTGFRFDPSHPDAKQTELLAHLAAIRSADTSVKELGPALRELGKAAEVLISRTKPATSTLGRVFAGRKRKDAAFAAATEIERRLAATTALVDQLDRAVQAADPRTRAAQYLWNDFDTDAASYYSILSTVGPTAASVDVNAAHGYIGDELSRQVADAELDTRLVKASLRGYQHFGAQFALLRRRAIIGDEMGLGKTVQALAACAHLAARGRIHSLVVCPASVLLNWMGEIAKHTLLTAHKLHGDERDAAGRHWLSEGGVAVTTFDTLPKLHCLKGIDSIAMLIADEAHYIKNPGTRRAKAMLPFIDRSDHVLFLSGTPLENRVVEFRNLVGYLQPRVAERITPGIGLAGAKSFRGKVAEVYLRRNQVDVLQELPDKIEVEDWVQFTAADTQAYRRILAENPSQGTLEKLRYAGYLSRDSAKLTRAVELAMEAVDDGVKVVVFSRYLDVLARIENALGEVASWKLTGSVPAVKRQPLIDEFTGHDGPAVLLTQIDTGGTGINLQAASTVIITEPQWKPTVEDQAVARLHRMGQVRKVQVHRVLAKATVDDLLLEVQERKRLLFNEFARKSAAKDADRRAVDTSTRPAVLQDDSIPLELRIVLAERERMERDHPS